MEPAGLAIGAIALASLFTECIKCLDLIELARSSEKGLKTHTCKLSIIKRQFMVWGESIGLLSPDEGRDDVLDQVKGRKEIEDVLQQISILLQDAEKLKIQYGVEVDRTDDRQSDCIEVSKRRRDVSKQNPIVEFITRLAAHQRRSTIITKTRWAIRDSKKFEGLVKDLDWFVTKLLTIDVSHETHIRQEMVTREEVESIVDLSTLTIMEQTCRGPSRSWAAAARIHSEYLSSAGSVVERNQRIRDWNAHLESTGSDSQSMSVDERTRSRQRYEALSPSLSTTSFIRPDSPPLRTPKKPNWLTQVYIFCCDELRSKHDSTENLLSRNMLSNLANEMANLPGLPGRFQHDSTENLLSSNVSSNLLSRNVLLNLANKLANLTGLPGFGAYHNARQKVISKVTNDSEFRSAFDYKHGHWEHDHWEHDHWKDGEYKRKLSDDRAEIHVFCPPLLQYIHFALVLASTDHGLENSDFQVVIHPDDRLLEEDICSVEEGHESLLQLTYFLRSSAEIGEPTGTFKLGGSRRHFLAARFNEVWMDQRITGYGLDKRTGDPIDASEFFKESKEGVAVALMIIMAGSRVCDNITSTAPLAGPDNPIQPSQIYRLQELADVDDKSLLRWKTTHFCRINWP